MASCDAEEVCDLNTKDSPRHCYSMLISLTCMSMWHSARVKLCLWSLELLSISLAVAFRMASTTTSDSTSRSFSMSLMFWWIAHMLKHTNYPFHHNHSHLCCRGKRQQRRMAHSRWTMMMISSTKYQTKLPLSTPLLTPHRWPPVSTLLVFPFPLGRTPGQLQRRLREGKLCLSKLLHRR